MLPSNDIAVGIEVWTTSMDLIFHKSLTAWQPVRTGIMDNGQLTMDNECIDFVDEIQK